MSVCRGIEEAIYRARKGLLTSVGKSFFDVQASEAVVCQAGRCLGVNCWDCSKDFGICPVVTASGRQPIAGLSSNCLEAANATTGGAITCGTAEGDISVEGISAWPTTWRCFRSQPTSEPSELSGTTRGQHEDAGLLPLQPPLLLCSNFCSSSLAPASSTPIEPPP